jgi:hypothetical protein
MKRPDPLKTIYRLSLKCPAAAPGVVINPRGFLSADFPAREGIFQDFIEL